MAQIYSRVFSGICLFIGGTLFGQNLIVNPGFEAYDGCPKNFTNISVLLKSISQPTASSGDYFNACNKEDFGVPANFKGNQKASEGNGYLGLYYYALNDYREYAQLDLEGRLRKEHPNKLSFKVSLAESSSLAIKNMSVMLCSDRVKLPNNTMLTKDRLDLVPGLEFYEVALKADKSTTTKDGWVTLTAEFDAKGFEKHLIVGNFKTNANTAVLTTKEDSAAKGHAYYFIDDFNLEELPRTHYEKDKIYVLEHNPMDPKGYDLDATAIASIQKIFKYLKQNAEVQLKITGHSTEAGTPEYNKFVSSLRARAVALYLKKLGIADERIVWEGVGETKTLRNGKIKQGHLAKRNVEFVVTDFEDQ